MTQQTHYFWAMAIPEKTKQQIAQHLAPLQKQLPFAKWVHPLDYHFTLAFLGSATDVQLQMSIERVQHALQHVTAFSLSLTQLGTFGQPVSPRIFWADIRTEQQLTDVQQLVFRACEQVGFSLDSKPFRPHMTIARKWSSEQPFQPERLQQLNPFANTPLSFIANEVTLYKTNMTTTPKYEAIAHISLQ